METRSWVIDLSCEVQPKKEDYREERMPYDVWTSQTLISFPSGCQNRVGLRLIFNGEQIFPKNTTWTALEDTTQTFFLVKKVPKDRTIRAEFKNNDTKNPHWISVLIQVSTFHPLTVIDPGNAH